MLFYTWDTENINKRVLFYSEQVSTHSTSQRQLRGVILHQNIMKQDTEFYKEMFALLISW